jgi:transposase
MAKQGGDAMATELLPDELWDQIQPLLPRHRAQPKGGRPPVDDRSCLRGLIFILRSGMAYSLLPTEVFGVSGVTCWRRLRDWTRAGVWSELHQQILNRLGKLGQIDLSKAVIDAQSTRAVFGGCTRAPTR